MAGPDGIPAGAVEVEVVEFKENWSVYTLEDGNVLRVRPVVVAVYAVPGETTPDGDPLYIIKSSLFVAVNQKK